MVLNPSVILYQELHQLVPRPSTQEHRCNCTLMASSHPRRACLRRLAGRCRRGRHGRRLRGVCGCTFLHHGRFPSASFFFLNRGSLSSGVFNSGEGSRTSGSHEAHDPDGIHLTGPKLRAWGGNGPPARHLPRHLEPRHDGGSPVSSDQ